jgi:hypothetical protein
MVLPGSRFFSVDGVHDLLFGRFARSVTRDTTRRLHNGVREM